MAVMGLGVAALVVVAIIVIILLWGVMAYNGLIRVRNTMKEAWAQIDVQLKRRHDLIPNLVETVKGYAGHESGTLEAVVKARGAAVNAQGAAQQAQAEGQLSGALSRLMLLVENYPNLKADANFRQLQEELTSTENKIGFARQFYNENVKDYNTRRETVPTNIIAGMFNFEKGEFFTIENGAEREAPQVKF